jgi:hypothetical protein
MKSILIFLFCIVLLSSCGKKEESEFTDEKSPNNQTEQPYKKDTSKVNPFKQNNESKTSEDKTTTHTLTPEKTVSALEAGNNIGRFVAVRGFVAEVKKTENVEYLDFVEKYPENPFTGVIFKSKFDEIGDIGIYENKNVEITGLISTYKGKPQIVIVNKNQIKIID